MRYQSGPSLTEYGFTGQFGYTGSFGLIYFNARWLDVSLGRFAQADSIVPPGVQGLDRYAYTNNNPVRYTDPSGHICVEHEGGNDEYTAAGNCHGFSRNTKPEKTLTPPLNPSDVNGGYDWGDDNGTASGHIGVDLDDALDNTIVTSSYGIVHSSDACSEHPCDNLDGHNGATVNGGYGNVVVIEYYYDLLPKETRGLLNPGDSLFIVYAHLKEPSPLFEGQLVKPGEYIGTVGSTGNSTGVHLHLETRTGESTDLPFLPMATDQLYSDNDLFWRWWQLELINPHDIFYIE